MAGYEKKTGGSSLVEDAAGGGPGDAAPGKRTLVEDLANTARTPNAVRGAIAANPGVAPLIPQFFAAGNANPALNALLGSAFPGRAKRSEADAAKADPAAARSKEKDPTDPTQALPAARSGDKKLAKGQLKWTLAATDHNSASVDVHFTPDKDKVQAKNVSYIQTVLNKVGNDLAYAGGTAANPALNKNKFEKFEEAGSKRRVDHLPDTENDPFYGAEWDQANKTWKDESADWIVGSSHKGQVPTTAKMYDIPGAGVAREGLGDASKEFETVPMVLETRQPLGSLRWGFKIKDEENAPIELTGGKDEDCTDAPTADWASAMDQFYVGKFEEILDDFDIAKSDLKPDHKAKLDSIVTKMKANVALKAQLGGAADLTGDEKFNQELSLKRATAARDYLVDKGIDAGRLELQSYGADWARAEQEAGKSEGKNRRVQIWLH
jgi:outer membrane protein OmpA-like peptidoglycan-associated protein